MGIIHGLSPRQVSLASLNLQMSWLRVRFSSATAALKPGDAPGEKSQDRSDPTMSPDRVLEYLKRGDTGQMFLSSFGCSA